MPDFEIDTAAEFDDTSAREWDRLLASSPADTVFLTSGWLRAWQETLWQNRPLVLVRARRNDALVGAAAFHVVDGVIRFAGTGPSDYADLVLAKDLDDRSADEVVKQLLEGAARANPNVRDFQLARIPQESLSIARLKARGSGYFATVHGVVLAPTMDMSAVDSRLKKKSLRRHERGLAQRGALEFATHHQAAEILPQLPEFFEQHVARWRGTEFPSLFERPELREFYTRVTTRLDSTGVLRFTTVRLDGALIAAHFGFMHAGRYIWYKPAFDPALAKFSPGEVLIKRLLEQAKAEGASEFDFTIGDEPFKLRFATRIREVVQVHLTRSPFKAAVRGARSFAKKVLTTLQEKTPKPAAD